MSINITLKIFLLQNVIHIQKTTKKPHVHLLHYYKVNTILYTNQIKI